MLYQALTSILSFTLLTSATPLTPRACSVAYPASIGFPINFDISQDAGATNKRDNFVSWNNIPAGSFGCELQVNFPAGYPITSSGASKINVFATDGPVAGSLVGTVTLASNPTTPTKFVINSFQCRDVMSYRLSIASEIEAGRLAFADTKEAGFTMAYNC